MTYETSNLLLAWTFHRFTKTSWKNIALWSTPYWTHVRLLWSCFIFRPSWARGVRTAQTSLRRPLQKASFPKRDTWIGEEATVPI